MSASVTSPVSDMLSEGSVAHSVMSDSSQRHGLQSTRLLCPWDSPGKNTEVGSHSLIPGDLPEPGIDFLDPGIEPISFIALHSLESPRKPYELYELFVYFGD